VQQQQQHSSNGVTSVSCSCSKFKRRQRKERNSVLACYGNGTDILRWSAAETAAQKFRGGCAQRLQ